MNRKNFLGMLLGSVAALFGFKKKERSSETWTIHRNGNTYAYYRNGTLVKKEAFKK